MTIKLQLNFAWHAKYLRPLANSCNHPVIQGASVLIGFLSFYRHRILRSETRRDRQVNEQSTSASTASSETSQSRPNHPRILINYVGKKRLCRFPKRLMANSNYCKSLIRRTVFSTGLIRRTSLASSSGKLQLSEIGSRTNLAPSSLQKRIDIISVCLK